MKDSSIIFHGESIHISYSCMVRKTSHVYIVKINGVESNMAMRHYRGDKYSDISIGV